MEEIKIFFKPYITYILIIINIIVFIYFYIFVLDVPVTSNTFECVKTVAPECIGEKEFSRDTSDCIRYNQYNNLSIESCFYDLSSCYKIEGVIDACGSRKTQALDKIGFNTQNTSFIKSVYTPITSMFVHKGFWHLFGNMVVLLIVGSYVESRLTVSRYIFVYFGSGILAVLIAKFLFDSVDKLIIGVGASGAIFGLLGANLVMAFYKRKDKEIAMLFGKIPTAGLGIGLLIVYFYLQIISVITKGNDGFGVLVHTIGFIIGFIITLYFAVTEKVD